MMNNPVNILLVDDDNNLVDGLRRSLRQEQYEVFAATSAIDAAKYLNEYEISLVVTDNQMPGIQGIDFLTRLKVEHPQIRRILMTGNASLPLALRAINEAEVFRFFVKPVNVIDLAISAREAIIAGRPGVTAKSLVDEAKFHERLERAVNGCVGRS